MSGIAVCRRGDGSRQRHVVVDDVHCDLLDADHRGGAQRVGHALGDVVGGDRQPDPELVGQGLDAGDGQHDTLGPVALPGKLDHPAQRDGAVAHRDVDVAHVELVVVDERIEDRRLGVGVGLPVEAHDAHAQLIVDVVHPGHVARRARRLGPLNEGAHGPAEDHVAVVVGLHGDLVGMDAGVVCERPHDRSLERLIGHAHTVHARMAARHTTSPRAA